MLNNFIFWLKTYKTTIYLSFSVLLLALSIYGLAFVDLDEYMYIEISTFEQDTTFIPTKIALFWALIGSISVFSLLFALKSRFLDLFTITLTGLSMRIISSFYSENSIIFNLIKINKNMTVTEKENIFVNLKGTLVQNNTDLLNLNFQDLPLNLLEIKEHRTFTSNLQEFLINFQDKLQEPVIENLGWGAQVSNYTMMFAGYLWENAGSIAFGVVVIIILINLNAKIDNNIAKNDAIFKNQADINTGIKDNLKDIKLWRLDQEVINKSASAARRELQEQIDGVSARVTILEEFYSPLRLASDFLEPYFLIFSLIYKIIKITKKNK